MARPRGAPRQVERNVRVTPGELPESSGLTAQARPHEVAHGDGYLGGPTVSVRPRIARQGDQPSKEGDRGRHEPQEGEETEEDEAGGPAAGQECASGPGEGIERRTPGGRPRSRSHATRNASGPARTGGPRLLARRQGADGHVVAYRGLARCDAWGHWAACLEDAPPARASQPPPPASDPYASADVSQAPLSRVSGGGSSGASVAGLTGSSDAAWAGVGPAVGPSRTSEAELTDETRRAQGGQAGRAELHRRLADPARPDPALQAHRLAVGGVAGPAALAGGAVRRGVMRVGGAGRSILGRWKASARWTRAARLRCHPAGNLAHFGPARPAVVVDVRRGPIRARAVWRAADAPGKGHSAARPWARTALGPTRVVVSGRSPRHVYGRTRVRGAQLVRTMHASHLLPGPSPAKRPCQSAPRRLRRVVSSPDSCCRPGPIRCSRGTPAGPSTASCSRRPAPRRSRRRCVTGTSSSRASRSGSEADVSQAVCRSRSRHGAGAIRRGSPLEWTSPDTRRFRCAAVPAPGYVRPCSPAKRSRSCRRVASSRRDIASTRQGVERRGEATVRGQSGAQATTVEGDNVHVLQGHHSCGGSIR